MQRGRSEHAKPLVTFNEHKGMAITVELVSKNRPTLNGSMCRALWAYSRLQICFHDESHSFNFVNRGPKAADAATTDVDPTSSTVPLFVIEAAF